MPNVYNTIYRGNFCSNDGTDNVIELKKRMLDTDVVPVPIPIVFAGHNDEPVTFEFTDKGDYKQYPINGLDATVNIKAVDSFELSSLYTADEREWMLSVSGMFNMTGFIIPDSCTEPYASKPYDVTIQVTDCLGTLEDIPFQQDNGVKYKGFLSDVQLIQICLAKTGLSLPLLVGVNTYEVTMNKTFSPFQQTYRDTARYLDADGNAFSCYEVLRGIMEHWSARLHQFNGFWQIVNVLEKSKGDITAWIYNTDGTANGSITLGNTVIAGGFSRDLQPTDAQNGTAKAFKSSTAYYQYGYPPSDLINGDFDDWNSPLLYPRHWFPVNGATGSTGTRIDQTTGIPTSDHYLIIKSNGSDGYFENDTSVSVKANQKVAISFDLQSKDAYDTLINGGKRFVRVMLRDNLGKYYNDKNGWQNSFAFYWVHYEPSEFKNDLRVSFEIGQQPVDYQLTFGIEAVIKDNGGSFQTSINNIKVQPQTISSQTAPPLGLFNRETLNAKQSYKKDPILLLHGDEINPQRTSRISIGSPNTIQPPNFWERSGVIDPSTGSAERKSLLHIVANSELRNHQRPYGIFTATFVGLGYIDINTLLKVDLLSPTGWIFMSGKFDIKTGYHTLKFAEVLTDEPAYVEEANIEDYGAEKGKGGFSVGQPDTVNTQPGGSYVDLNGYALKADVPVKANATETQNGTNDDKFITPFKLLGWWTWIKTQVATISGSWNFTARPTYNGSNLLTSADLPTPPPETDTLQSVTTRGATTDKTILIKSDSNPGVRFQNLANTFDYLFYGGANNTGAGFYDYKINADILTMLAGKVGIRNVSPQEALDVTGKARVSVAPTNPTDVVRLQELTSFKGSDTVLSKNSSYTILMSDFGTNGNVTVYVDTTSGNVAITLPSAANMNGYTANIIKTSSDVNSVVVTATINGIANDLLSNQYDAGTYKGNGSLIFKF